MTEGQIQDAVRRALDGHHAHTWRNAMANKSNGKKSKTKSAPVHEEMSTSEEMIIDVERTYRAIAAKYGMSDDERNELFRSISMICMAQLARGEGPFYDIAHGGGLVQ